MIDHRPAIRARLAAGCFLPEARAHALPMLEQQERRFAAKDRMMTLQLIREPVTQPCGWCMGNGCSTCRGTGEETVCLEHWRCTSCLVEGEGDPGKECPSCGDDAVETVDEMPNDEPDLPMDQDDYRENYR